MPDLSAQFRLDLPEVYHAFGVYDRRSLSLRVQPAYDAPFLTVRYATLLYTQMAPSQTRLDLVFGSVVVSLGGRHLSPLQVAVSQERCAWVQQYDPARWPLTPGTGEPFIASVKVHLSVSPERIAELAD
jgi:hypothetical protein